MPVAKTSEALEQRIFRRILLQNLALPIIVSLVLAVIFTGLVLSLLDSHRWVDHTNRIISRANRLTALTVDAETGMRGYLVTNDVSFLEPRVRARNEIPIVYAELFKMVSDNPTQSERLRRAKSDFDNWQEFTDETISSFKKIPHEKLVERSKSSKALMDSIRVVYLEFISSEQNLRDERVNRSREWSRWILIGSVGFTFIFGILLALFGRRQLIVLTNRFGEALNQSREQNEALEAEAWLQTGQAKISDAIQGDVTVNDICQRGIEFLANYFGAKIGRIFVLDQKSQLVSCGKFAFDEKVNPDSSAFALGQGTIGQCASEKRVLELFDLPSDYLKISSSLGQTPVRNILLAPLLMDGELKGVIELGFINQPSAQVKKLLQRVGERLAFALHSSQYRMRLRELLEETTRQSEELQAQHEEMESINEDLHQKSQELLAQQHSLEQTNGELEQQQTLLEEQKQRLEEANLVLSRTQSEVDEKNKTLETANRYKSEFLANMSHELRTPLNSILLLSNLLQENNKANLDAEDTEYASTIHSSASDLLNLINDILDLSKVEAGKLDLNPEPVSLSALANSLERNFSQQATSKGLKFEVSISPDVTPSVVTDRQRCEQILRNFLSNATKFTETGSIRLDFKPSQDATYEVAISVTDTGIGIPADKQSSVFEAFQQADGTISRKYGGTGLGLTIATELSKLLNGKIELQSTEAEGSVFTLYLPSRMTVVEKEVSHSAPITWAPTPIHSASLRPQVPHEISDDRHDLKPGEKPILVVEDDMNFAKVLMSLAKQAGFKCLLANNGETGLEEANRFLPAAVILDLNLPRLSGQGVLEGLKGSLKTRHIPVHVFSVEDRSREVLGMGAAEFTSKPVSKIDLEKALDRIANRIKHEIKYLLVIEDSELEQESIRKLIGNGDVITEVASTGAEALEKLAKRNYDCIILDLKLPDMTGFDLLAQLQSKNDFRVPPVIIYTARDLTKEEQLKLSEVSQSIVLKGAKSPERLLDEVTLFLHKMEDKLSQTQKEILLRVRHREDLFQDKKILIVDDDMRNIFALRSVLLRKGFHILIARTGKEALTRLEENPEIDVVLMDIMMPEMDGIEAITRIRQNPLFRKLPIITLTAKAMRTDRDKCLAAGASDYLPKPVDMTSLLSLLRIWLTK